MFRKQSSAAVCPSAGVCVCVCVRACVRVCVCVCVCVCVFYIGWGVGVAEGIAGVEHLLVDCVDLQRRELWQYVAAWGAATHLLDPVTQRLHPKVRSSF